MRITWYGTAGFLIETGGSRFLVDPFLSRGDRARPESPAGVEDLVQVDQVYLSHGHFDHASDVPSVASQTGATVYCSKKVAQALVRQGLSRTQIETVGGGESFDHGTYRARCFPSHHVRFDLPLVAATLRRVVRERPTFPPLVRWPCGQVLAWRFTLTAEGGRVIQHFGSAGCTDDELDRLAALGRLDVLLVPLQGHSHVHRIAARIVERLEPQVVVPHHHDDFFPPISQRIDVGPFVDLFGRRMPAIQVVELPIGEATVVQARWDTLAK